MDVLDRPLHFYAVKIFWYTGLHPESKSRLIDVVFLFNFTGLLMWLVLGGIGVFKFYKTDLNAMIECLQTFILMIHCIGKQASIFFKKPHVGYLIDQTSAFWNLSELRDAILEAKYRRTLERAHLFARSCALFGVAIVSLFYLQPFITGTLPTVCYEPEGWHRFLILSFWYLCYFMYGGIVGTNLFFFTSCVPVIVQFKILKAKFGTLEMGRGDVWRELNRLITHHKRLLEYCDNINELFGSIFLLEGLISVFTSCLGLFIVMHGEIPLGNKLKYVLYFVGELIGTGIFCFSAELISDASSDFASAIYGSAWYDAHSSVRKAVKLLLMRSQKAVTFSGHGLVTINIATFTVVFKSILSFYTYLKTVEERNLQQGHV